MRTHNDDNERKKHGKLDNNDKAAMNLSLVKEFNKYRRIWLIRHRKGPEKVSLWLDYIISRCEYYKQTFQGTEKPISL